MLTAAIAVKKIWPPSGKGPGAVVDTAGVRFQVWPDLLCEFQEGASYKISYDSKEYNGRTQFTIRKIMGDMGDVADRVAALPPQSPGAFTVTPPRAVVQAPATTGLTPKDKMIYVCGVVNNAMSNPNVNPLQIGETDLATITNVAMAAFDLSLGKE